MASYKDEKKYRSQVGIICLLWKRVTLKVTSYLRYTWLKLFKIKVLKSLLLGILSRVTWQLRSWWPRYKVQPQNNNQTHTRFFLKKRQLVLCFVADPNPQTQKIYLSEEFARCAQAKICWWVVGSVWISVLTDSAWSPFYATDTRIFGWK